MPDSGAFTLQVDAEDAGCRIDTFLAARIPECPRSLAARLVREGTVRVRGEVKKPGYRVRCADIITGSLCPPEPLRFEPEPIPLDILYEDSDLIVINKPPGLVVHPAPGHLSGTLVNALLHHCPGIAGSGPPLRPGIVHRLDKDTTGTLVVAKTALVHRDLAEQFKKRTIEKTYLAVVWGDMPSDGGTIRLPLGRHPVDRKRMSTASRRTRSAETNWRVRERFGGLTLLEVDLKTGRTHQIRVHCAAIHHPIVGDPVYGYRNRPIQPARQMLHAWRLGFVHPIRGDRMVLESPVPSDMAGLIEGLRPAEENPTG